MIFNENIIFHIYNQGNNKQQVFFKEAHYLDFLARIRRFILPHAEILSYCLMPNHFHLQVYVKKINLNFPIEKLLPSGEKYISKYSERSLNFSIGILLRSYTDMINKERSSTGSLFRQKTKAKEDWINDFVTVNHPRFKGEKNYGLNCFYYVHNNPIKAGLVKDLKDWPYSSYMDYIGERHGTLCNQKLAEKLFGVAEFY